MRMLKFALIAIIVVGLFFGIFYTQMVKGGTIPNYPYLVQVKNDTMSFNIYVLFKEKNRKHDFRGKTRVLPGSMVGHAYHPGVEHKGDVFEVEIFKGNKSCIRSVSIGDKIKVSSCKFK